jgi:two-component system sensor histidine kinase UhpB
MTCGGRYIFRRMQKAFVSGLVLLLSLQVSAQVQQRKDSVQTVLSHAANDLTRVKLLLQLSDKVAKTDPDKGKQYSHMGLQLASTNGYTQETCDLNNLLGELFHSQSAYDSSFHYHRKALTLAREIKNEVQIATALRGIAKNFMRRTELDSARYYLSQALNITAQFKDPSYEGGIYNDLGNVCIGEHNYPEALKQFINAAKQYESVSSDNIGLGKAWGNIGNIEQILGHPDKALDYTLRSLKIFEKERSDPDIAYTYKLLGRIYRKQSATDKALRNYQQALTIYARLGDKRDASEVHHGMGNIYYDQRKFKDALHHYEESLSIAASIADRGQMAYCYSAIGYVWYELKNIKKSIAYFDTSAVKAREVKNRYLTMDAYEMLSSIQQEQHNYKEALKLHRSYSDLKDSLMAEENNLATEELETKYRTAKKQAEIELLEKDRQIKSAALRQQRTVQTALLLAIILIVAVSLLLFNRYRLVQRAKRQAEAEQMRNQIARDLHDDVGSILSSIHIISQLAMKENKPEYFNQHFQRIGEQSAKMMERMSDMIWSINPGNDSLEKMVVKMKEFLTEILEAKNIGYEFAGEETLHGLALSPEKRKNLFLIFKEAINNSAKYSEASFVDIALLQHDGQLHLSIADNGKGFDLGQVKKGNGLRNMKERAEDVNAWLELNPNKNNGTSLKLVMPLHD